MYTICQKELLNPTVCKMVIQAPHVAKHAKAGQFVILRVHEGSERFPLTIADHTDTTITLIFQIIGKATQDLNALEEGQAILDVAGPLGNPSEIEGEKVIVVGGGVGCAIAYPTAKAFHQAGKQVTSIVGFRQADLAILEKEFKAVSDHFIAMSDDGSYGQKGLVTDALASLLEKDSYDRVIAIGPLIMMKFVCELTKRFNIPTTVSMNPIMIDGTGMCGCCRLHVGGQMHFACVDGPDFDGHLVNFDEAISRNKAYREQQEREANCRLMKKESQYA